MILITGATGKIGRYLLKFLLSEKENDEKIRILVRRTSNLDFDFVKERGDIEIFYGDLRDKETLKNAVQSVEKIFHLAANTSPLTSREGMFSINFEGTKNLVEVSLNENSIEKFLHCSSVSVMGNDIKNPPADENYPCNPTNNYGLSKLEAEKICFEYYEKNKFPVTILRPSWVYGSGFSSGVDIILKILNSKFIPFIPIPGNGKNLKHFVHVKDVIQGMNLAMENKKSIGEIYIIAGDRPYTLEEFFNICAQVLRVERKPRIHIPKILVKTFATIEETKKFFGMKPMLTRIHADALLKNQSYSIEKAKEHLGYKPKISLKKGVREIAECG